MAKLTERVGISGCSAVGSALALGARCREFESLHSDQKSTAFNRKLSFFSKPQA